MYTPILLIWLLLGLSTNDSSSSTSPEEEEETCLGDARDKGGDVGDGGDGVEGECAKNEVLLITGSGSKGKFDSVTALERLKVKQSFLQPPQKNTDTKDISKHNNDVTMAVAFNPFFPSVEDFEAEKKRLVQKLDTGQVQKVYLQFGTDLQRLRSAMDWLQELKTIHPSFDICGSIFLPTKKLNLHQPRV